MTDTAEPRSLSLASELAAFLRNPVIKITHTDEVSGMRDDLNALQEKYDKLTAEYESLLAKYRQELYFTMRLQDLCKEHGVKWR